MNKFIIECSNSIDGYITYNIYKIESESKEKIKEMLNPILEEFVNKIIEMPPSWTWGIREWSKEMVPTEFTISDNRFRTWDFLHFDYNTYKKHVHYEILTLDEWFEKRKIILEDK
jgi:hypothetical protein